MPQDPWQQPSAIIHNWIKKHLPSFLRLSGFDSIYWVIISHCCLTTNRSRIYYHPTSLYLLWLQHAFNDGHFYSARTTTRFSTGQARDTQTRHIQPFTVIHDTDFDINDRRDSVNVSMPERRTAHHHRHSPRNWPWSSVVQDSDIHPTRMAFQPNRGRVAAVLAPTRRNFSEWSHITMG